jgi:predicted methyltransferase
MIDLYWYLADPKVDSVAFLRKIANSLAPGGRLGVVDFTKDGAGGPGPVLSRRVAPEVVIRDATAAGLTLRSRETFLRYQYLLIFGRSNG